MADATSCRGYPYPTDDDPPDIPGYFADLALAVDGDICDLDGDTIHRTGGSQTMSPSLTITAGDLTISAAGRGVILPAGEPSAANRAARKDYVDTKVAKTGDSMTGLLHIAAPTGGIRLRRTDGAELPYLDFYNEANDTRFGFLQGSATEMRLFSDNALKFYTDTVTNPRVSIVGATMLYGKTSADLSVAGVEIGGTGSAALGSLRSTIDTAGLQNAYFRHGGTADANNELFVQFLRAVPGAEIGSIKQNSTTGVTYNTTSDYRLKDDLGAVIDPVERLMQLRPRHLRWKETGAEFDGFLAHEVGEVVPDATSGDYDAVYSADEAHAMGIAEGTIKPQQLDASRIIPLIVATVQALVGRVEVLEAA